MRDACLGASSRQAGGPTRSGLIAIGLRGSLSRFLWNLNWEWRVSKIKAELKFFVQRGKREDGGREDE